MPWPVTFSNGNKWTEGQFSRFAYTQNLPGILQDVADEATRVIGVVGTAQQLAAAMQAGPVASIQRRGRALTGQVILDPAEASLVLPSAINHRLQPGFVPESGAFARASVATFTDPRGVVLTAASGVPRFTCDPLTGENQGMLLEGGRTTYLANPASPATQTVSLAAATYTLWVVGTGSAALSGGPTGTATQGSPVTFTLAGTTGVTVTVSGALTRFQLENGSFPTSFIPATTAPVTRATDVYTYTLPADLWNPAEGTIIVDAVSPAGTDGLQQVVEFCDASFNNRILIARDGNRQAAIVGTAAASGWTVPLLGSWPDLSRRRFALGFGGGTFGVSVNGAAPVTGNIPGVPAGTQLRVGSGQNSNRWWFGSVSIVTYIPRRVSNTALPLMSTL